LNLVSYACLICYQKYVTVTDHKATAHSKNGKCSSCPRNTLNIMPIINRILLLGK
jgi:predicted SprT family Zn-dependent metalloprotease